MAAGENSINGISVAPFPCSSNLTDHNNYYQELPFLMASYQSYNTAENEAYIIFVRKRFEQLSIGSTIAFEEPAIYKYDTAKDAFTVLETANNINYYPFTISSICVDPINKYLFIIMISPSHTIKIFDLETNKFLPKEYKYYFYDKIRNYKQMSDILSVFAAIFAMYIGCTLICVAIIYLIIVIMLFVIFRQLNEKGIEKGNVYHVEAYFVSNKNELHLFGYTDNNYTYHIFLQNMINDRNHFKLKKLNGVSMYKRIKYGYNQVLYLEKTQMFVNVICNSDNSRYWDINQNSKCGRDEWMRMDVGYLTGLRHWMVINGSLLMATGYDSKNMKWIDTLISMQYIEGKLEVPGLNPGWFGPNAIYVGGNVYRFGLKSNYKFDVNELLPTDIRDISYFEYHRKFVIGYLRTLCGDLNLFIPNELTDLVAYYYPIFL